MRKTILIICFFIFTYTIYAQDTTFIRNYELMGSASYDFSVTILRVAGEDPTTTLTTHSILVSTTGGYFLNPRFELLFDLHYTFFFTYDRTYFNTLKEADHRIGLKTGIVYNFNLNKNVEFFTGAKIGINWTHSAYGNHQDADYISDWSKPEIAFPIILFGSRFLISKNCSFVPQIEYEYIGKKENIFFWTRSSHNLSVNFGISVFL
jgi:hypothetical protein